MALARYRPDFCPILVHQFGFIESILKLKLTMTKAKTKKMKNKKTEKMKKTKTKTKEKTHLAFVRYRLDYCPILKHRFAFIDSLSYLMVLLKRYKTNIQNTHKEAHSLLENMFFLLCVVYVIVEQNMCAAERVA